MTALGLVAGVTLLAIGFLGIMRALPVVRARHPTTLMPYPVSLPWLAARPTTASTVLRIGQTYAIAGLILTMYAVATLDSQRSTPPAETCITMADQLVQMQPSSPLFAASLQREAPQGSECTVHAADGTEWFRIRTERRDDAIGEVFNARSTALERLGMAIEPLTVEGRRAIVGLAGSETNHEPQILIEAETAIHTIVVRQPAAKETELNQLLSGFRGR